MAPPDDDHGRIEQRIEELKASLAKYKKEAGKVDSEVVADLTRAMGDIGDHLVDLSRRIKRIEDSQEEWTTRGWLPPSGDDSGSAA